MDRFDLYFATLVGMQMHPGYNRENAEPLTIMQCKEIAEAMCEVAEERKQCQS